MTSAPLPLVVTSANPHKAAEIFEILSACLGDAVSLIERPLSVPEVEETGSTLLDNARLKADALCAATGHAAIGDDTGLEVDALGGAPGVYSARDAGPEADYLKNVAKLLGALEGVENRRATFRTVAVVAFPDGRELVTDGSVDGVIALQMMGTTGFGYDPIFVPHAGDGRSYAEMQSEEKHALSHRGEAMRLMAAKLQALLDSSTQ